MVDSQKFNLATDPWIKVVTVESNQEKMVSLIDLFKNAADYRQLAGDMHSQDFALLRLLLAILTTVYSRVDANNTQYEWLDGDVASPETLDLDLDTFDDEEGKETLFATWGQLYQAGHFSSAVTAYLTTHVADFEFLGEHPFYQAATADYDALVPANRKVATGKGEVLVQQMNRRISESANTPDTFAPKSGEAKNTVSLDELARWVVTYQNFTGVTDKTKVVTKEKFSNAKGWVYGINPVFAKGKTLFETLMLNLILVDVRQEDADYALQKPVWEVPSIRDYVEQRKTQILPDNLAELYTAWSRLLHIDWRENGRPTILSAGIPMFAYEGALIEPMTTWRLDKKTSAYRPVGKSLRSLGTAMWRNFGQYVNVHRADDMHEPGIVIWLRTLQRKHLIAKDAPLFLNSVALVSDGNATSQSPAAEVVDDLEMQADVLFDEELTERWPVRIEEAIETTQTIGKDYYHFAVNLGKIRNLDTRTFASGMSAKFYERLNSPFKAWLSGLSGQDDRDAQINRWKAQLEKIVVMAVDDEMRASSPRDAKGINDGDYGPLNIFTAKNRLMYQVRRDLDLKKE